MMFISTIIISAALILIDLVPLYKQQEWKIFFIYSFFLLFIVVLGLLADFNVEIPSPSKPTKDLVSLIFGLKLE
ncbi:MAG: hypothetical protein GX184_01340 [Clostridiaceae bacterium]|nr:hypothetical protein [Clostridiaceae bacterium]